MTSQLEPLSPPLWQSRDNDTKKVVLKLVAQICDVASHADTGVRLKQFVKYPRVQVTVLPFQYEKIREYTKGDMQSSLASRGELRTRGIGGAVISATGSVEASQYPSEALTIAAGLGPNERVIGYGEITGMAVIAKSQI
jgi:hypothetical protein